MIVFKLFHLMGRGCRLLHSGPTPNRPNVHRSLISLVAACVVLLVCIPACQDTRAVKAARARLDLARQRTDLGEMFLALRDLESLGVKDPTIATELAQIGSALQIEQQMKGEGADHNHEAAVMSAGAILDLFPNHVAARQILKESGLIYRSLQAALTSMRDCFQWNSPDKEPKLISVTISMPIEKLDPEKKGRAKEDAISVARPDFAKIVYHLSKATAAVNRAVQLDPQFERAITIKKLTENVQAFMGITMADSVLSTTRAQLNTCELEGNLADDWIRLGMKSHFSPSPWKYWGEARKTFATMVDVDELMPQDDILAALLKLQTPHNEYFRNVAELSLKVGQLRKAIENPTGTIVDYRRTVSDTSQQVTALVSRVAATYPDTSSLLESIAVMASFQLYRAPSETEAVIDKYKELIER